jgi:3-hydroxybutyryl-CoA dehydrogenase
VSSRRAEHNQHQISRVLVLGAGTMGTGIARVVAQAGLWVSLCDVSPDALGRARERIERALDRDVERDRLPAAEAEAVLGRIAPGTGVEEAAAETDHVIETVVEELATKLDVLGRVDRVAPEPVVLASNTSQFPISRLAAGTSRPDRVIGSHWFNPPPVMNLIEVVRGVETSDETVEATLELARRYGKETVVCKRDSQGFITSRLIVMLALEAARIVEEGVAEPEDVNRACERAFNHAMGPLATVDMSGLDVTLHVADSMRQRFGDRFLAPQNLRNLVDAGHLGRKTGRGFDSYERSA